MKQLPKLNDIVATPRGNTGKVISIDGSDATVLITEPGNNYMVTLARKELKVVKT